MEGADAEGRSRLGSVDSLGTPRDSRTGSALQRLSLVEIVSPANAVKSSSVVLDDLSVQSSLNPATQTDRALGSSFEHALVMGVSDETVRGAVEAGDWGVYDPVTLASFPPDKPLALEALADFIFPSGVQFTKIGRKTASSPKFGSSSANASGEGKVKNIREMVLLFDTTATDYDEGDSDDLSLSDDEEGLNPRIKTSTLYGIAVTFTVTLAVTVKSSSTWSGR